MARYHMNPATGNPNKCSAKEGNCPFKSDDGSEATHYESPNEARAGYEQEQRDARDKAERLRAEERERNWPTPSDERVAEFEKKGYAVDPKGKGIMRRGERDGRRWEITVRSGTVNASIGMPDSFGSAFTIHTRMPYQGETATHQVEFGDFGTTLSIESAEQHVKEMEDVLRQAPKLIDQTNKMIADSKELFGEPKKAPYEGLYTEVPQVETFTGTRDAQAQRFTVDNRGSYINIQPENAGRLDTRSDSNADLFTDGRESKPEARISLSSFGTMDRDEYQARAERLKDTVATAKAMESTATALVAAKK